MHNLQTLIDDGNTKVWKYNLDDTVIQGLYDDLQENCPWIYADQVVYGKSCKVPRGMMFYGDAGVKEYKYSKLAFPVVSWDGSDEQGNKVKEIRDLVQEHIATLFPGRTVVTFDSCLLNYYRDGREVTRLKTRYR